MESSWKWLSLGTAVSVPAWLHRRPGDGAAKTHARGCWKGPCKGVLCLVVVLLAHELPQGWPVLGADFVLVALQERQQALVPDHLRT